MPVASPPAPFTAAAPAIVGSSLAQGKDHMAVAPSAAGKAVREGLSATNSITNSGRANGRTVDGLDAFQLPNRVSQKSF
jgi:hypothetical protein